MKEIGSEYHYERFGKMKHESWEENENWVDSAFVFSGRTAIETILKNVPHVKKAMLPSYCCESMIEPFRRMNIDLSYYNVNFDNGLVIDVHISEDVDLILWCNYFGFKVEMPDFSHFLQRGGIIVEDITHSFFSKKSFHTQSQYLVASLRKWGPLLSGGYCVSLKEVLCQKPKKNVPQEFLIQKSHAMNLKAEYLRGRADIDKTAFLNEFSATNSWISNNYSELTMDDESIEIWKSVCWKEVCKIRKRNAMELYVGLKNHSSLKVLFNKDVMDCPLFVPIIIENGERDNIRKKLIENGIYCPIHWPKPNERCESNLYDMELSLICDQRYNEEDMRRILSVICDL